MANRSKVSIGIIMGSQSDWATMRAAAEMLDALGIGHETRIVSAHRTPDRMAAYAKEAEARGLKAIIAGAGGAAHLPGMVASMTTLPVLGVPVQSRALKGLIRCSRSLRCPVACRWRRLPLARRVQRTRRCMAAIRGAGTWA